MINSTVLKQASWLSGTAFVSGAGGLKFKSRVGQIGHSFAYGSPPLRHFFEKAVLPAGSMMQGWYGLRQFVARFGVVQRV